jgi:hypothetical protein
MLFGQMNWLDCKRLFAIKVWSYSSRNLKREVAVGIVDFLKDAPVAAEAY